MRPPTVLIAGAVAVAAAAFVAGAWWTERGPGGGAPSGSAPVVALDPASVDLAPRGRLTVDWGALPPPSAPLPAPAAAPSAGGPAELRSAGRPTAPGSAPPAGSSR